MRTNYIFSGFLLNCQINLFDLLGIWETCLRADPGSSHKSYVDIKGSVNGPIFPP